MGLRELGEVRACSRGEGREGKVELSKTRGEERRKKGVEGDRIGDSA